VYILVKYKNGIERGVKMFIIVGLGNPTKEYDGTRHNVGFDVIDAIADKYNISVTERKCRAFCGSGIIEGRKVILVKPQTYMNLSGESVRGFVDFYKIDVETELLVIYDDVSLDVGQLRIRKKGSGCGRSTIFAHASCKGCDGSFHNDCDCDAYDDLS
jgi:PTH1 family peptidyl-tRNA hydrolase